MTSKAVWRQPDGRVIFPDSLGGFATIIGGRLTEASKHSSGHIWLEKAWLRRSAAVGYLSSGGQRAILCDEHEWVRLGLFESCRVETCSKFVSLCSASDVPGIEVEPCGTVPSLAPLSAFAGDGRLTGHVWVMDGWAIATDGHRIAALSCEAVDGAYDPETLALVDAEWPSWPMFAAGVVLADWLGSTVPMLAKELRRSAKLAALIGLTDEVERWEHKRWSRRKPTIEDVPVPVEVAGRRTFIRHGYLKDALRQPWVGSRRAEEAVPMWISSGGVLYVGGLSAWQAILPVRV